MSTDRIGSECWYRTYSYSSRAWSELKHGRVLHWTVYGTEDGFSPSVIVENMETNCCEYTDVDAICFASRAKAEVHFGIKVN
jgi:hypothetical protein